MGRHADLSGVGEHGWNEIVVDGRGNIYLNSIRFGFLAGEPPTSGIIALVTPDGAARQVAGDLAFPNGMVITPDNATLIVSESFAGRLTAFDIAADGSLSNRRVWAEGLGPDGICLDAEGADWVQTADVRLHSGRDDAPRGAVARIRKGGDGMVLVAGAPETTFADLIANPCAGLTAGPSAELYDPKTGRWTITGPMITGRADQAAVLLPDGTVLVAGGSCGGTYVNGKPTDVRCLDTLASAELYRPRLKTWALTAPLHMARLNPTATLLPNGAVLVTGGVGTKGVLASAEVYNP